jgi:hypothetical protein
MDVVLQQSFEKAVVAKPRVTLMEALDLRCHRLVDGVVLPGGHAWPPLAASGRLPRPRFLRVGY